MLNKITFKIISPVFFYVFKWLLENFKLHTWFKLYFYWRGCTGARLFLKCSLKPADAGNVFGGWVVLVKNAVSWAPFRSLLWC